MNALRRTSLLLIAGSLLSFCAASYARTEIYVQPLPIEVPADMTGAAVKDAIFRAFAKRSWIGKELSATELEAQYTRANKHSMTVRVQYTDKQVILSHKDSFNLNYQGTANNASIHPTGNFWLRNLRADIESSLISVKMMTR